MEAVLSPAEKASGSSAVTLGEVTVSITSSGFSPDSITVQPGTKVTWVNNSGGVANVSSDPHPTHTLYPPLNLGRVAGGASVSLVFDKAGSYGYHNHLNPGWTGKVTVQ